MKKQILLIVCLCGTLLLQAQVSKTVSETTAGTLSTLLTAGELSTVTNLTITGTIDKRDFSTMRDNMPALSVVDISGTIIAAVNITHGVIGNNFDANVVPDSAFYNTNTSVSKVSLTSIVLPSTATAIGTDAFRGCTGLTSIIIPSQVTNIKMMAFAGCKGLTSVTIPSSVTTYNLEDFYNCTGLTSIYSYATTPVDLTTVSSVFGNVNTGSCTLYVPVGSKTLYQAADQWSAFTNIVEYTPPANYSLTVSSNTATVDSASGSNTSITITSNTSWTASSNQTWLTINTASGNNDATITLTASSNPADTTRTAHVTIAGTGVTSQIIVVTQAAGKGTSVTGLTVIDNGNLILYPNPATTSFTINTVDNGVVQVFDIHGTLIESIKVLGNEPIATSNLKTGLYVVKIITGNNGVITKSLVIE